MPTKRLQYFFISLRHARQSGFEDALTLLPLTASNAISAYADKRRYHANGDNMMPIRRDADFARQRRLARYSAGLQADRAIGRFIIGDANTASSFHGLEPFSPGELPSCSRAPTLQEQLVPRLEHRSAQALADAMPPQGRRRCQLIIATARPK